MATVSTNYARPTSEVATSNVDRVTNILHWTYGLVPIVAGADKFANILTDWSQYLAPVVANIIPAQTFMMIVGIIEIHRRDSRIGKTKNWKSYSGSLAYCNRH